MKFKNLLPAISWTQTPTITYRTIQDADNVPRVEMVCHYDTSPDTNIVYDVTWYADDVMLKSYTGSNSMRHGQFPATITEKDGLRINTVVKYNDKLLGR